MEQRNGQEAFLCPHCNQIIEIFDYDSLVFPEMCYCPDCDMITIFTDDGEDWCF